MVNLLKRAYKLRRENKEIYKGFGFKHLSDGTNYYVHKNNQSINKKTTLAQAIGEAINFYYDILNYFNYQDYEDYGNIYKLNDDVIYIYFNVLNSHKLYDIFPSNVEKIKVKIDDDTININILDINDKILVLDEYYEVMLGNLALFARHILTTNIFDDEMSDFLLKDSIDFLNNPTASLFVKIHENFYQFYKYDEFLIDTKEIIIIDDEDIVDDIGKTTYARRKKDEVKLLKDEEILKFDSFDEMLVPDLSKAYIIDPKIVPLGNAIVNGDAISTLFFGPSGTGKTITCKLLCQQMRLPILATINCSENIDEFILGKYIPIEDKIVFRESEISKAIRDGGAVIFEEINFSKPQHLAFLNSLLDTNGFVRLDNGELIRRHKNFRFFATMNIGYNGTRELNQALFNRFNIVCEIEKLDKSAIINMLKVNVPECINNIDSILNVYYNIEAIIKRDELDFVISPRNLENFAKLAKYLGYLKAAEVSIIPIVKEDEYYKKIFRELIFKEKWV